MRPDTARSLPRIRLDKRTAAAVGARHPWVWQDVLESQPRSLAAGDEVVLLELRQLMGIR